MHLLCSEDNERGRVEVHHDKLIAQAACELADDLPGAPVLWVRVRAQHSAREHRAAQRVIDLEDERLGVVLLSEPLRPRAGRPILGMADEDASALE